MMTVNGVAKDKHKIDVANGWYRFDSRFTLSVFDENGEIE